MSYTPQTRYPWTAEQDAYMRDPLGPRIASGAKAPKELREQALSDLAELGPKRTWTAVMARAYVLNIRPRTTTGKAAARPKPTWTVAQEQMLRTMPIDRLPTAEQVAAIASLGEAHGAEAIRKRARSLRVQELVAAGPLVGSPEGPPAPLEPEGPWGKATKAELWQALGLMHLAAFRAAADSARLPEAYMAAGWLDGAMPRGVSPKDAREALHLGERAWMSSGLWPCTAKALEERHGPPPAPSAVGGSA